MYLLLRKPASSGDSDRVRATDFQREQHKQQKHSNKSQRDKDGSKFDEATGSNVQSHFGCSKSDRQVGLADRDRGNNGEFSDASSLSEYWCVEQLSNRWVNSEIKHKFKTT